MTGTSTKGQEEVVARARRHATRRTHFTSLVRQSWLNRFGVLFVGLVLALTVVGPLIGPHPVRSPAGPVLEAPSAAHLFGTDGSGLDVFSRVLAAPRINVSIALVAVVLSLTIGTLVGLVASYFRGQLGELVMRASDTAQAFPLFVLAIVLVFGAGRTFGSMVAVIALLNVPIFLRLIRSEVVSLRERSFVEAARAGGCSEIRIALRHVLPNALTPALAQSSITMGYSVLVVAGLSFVGAGVRPPTPEWGAMIAAGSDYIVHGMWWVSFFPGLVMSLTIFSFAIVGEMLRAVFTRER